MTETATVQSPLPTVAPAFGNVLDFAGDLYGQHLRVDFLHKIRDEQKFPDLDALKARIAEDCDIARELLAANESV